MNVGAVVLAAGGSARFAKPKQLAIFRGETLVRRIVAAANEAECVPIVVVVGREATQITSELAGLPVSIAVHRGWSNGLGSSIAVGLKHALGIVANLDAAILLTCDQPFVNAATLRQLIQLHLENGTTIVASAYAETLLGSRRCLVDPASQICCNSGETWEPKESFLPGETMSRHSIFPLRRSTSTPPRITKRLVKRHRAPNEKIVTTVQGTGV